MNEINILYNVIHDNADGVHGCRQDQTRGALAGAGDTLENKGQLPFTEHEPGAGNRAV